MNKNIIIGIVVIVLVALGFMLFKGGNGEEVGGAITSPEQEVKYTDPHEGETATEGRLACTPLKSGEATSPENCVIGLQGADGKFYALDTSTVEIISKGINPDTDVRAVGKLTNVDRGSEEAGIFVYDGVIKVRVLQAKTAN
jgi:hypothetical protein